MIIFSSILDFPFKRSHSPFHLLLRAQGYPLPPSTSCRPSWLCTSAYWHVFSLCLSFSLPCRHALLLSFRSPLLLSLVPLTAKDLFSPASLLSWPEASLSKFPCRAHLTVCLGVLYLSYCPCPFLSSSRAVRGRSIVLSPLSAFLCGFSS